MVYFQVKPFFDILKKSFQDKVTKFLRRLTVFLLVLGFLFPGFIYAIDYSSSNFKVKDPVIKSGAGFATSTNFKLWGAIGQESIGTSTATTFGLRAGFLFFPAPAASPPPPGGGPGGGGGGTTIAPKPTSTFPPIFIKPCPMAADFNCDGRVDFVDLSILLYYFDQPIEKSARYDLSQDGVLDIADVSVLFYFWSVPLA